MQQASHNGRRCSTYIIKSPLTVVCPVESRGAPKWNFCIYNHFPHFSSNAPHLSLSLSPKNPQDAQSFLLPSMPSTLHTNQEHQDCAQISYEPLGFLGGKKKKTFRCEPAIERTVGVGGGCILSFWFQRWSINLW